MYLLADSMFCYFLMLISVLKHKLQSLTIEAKKYSAMGWFLWVWHGSDSVLFTLIYPHYIHDTWQVKVLLSPLGSHKRLSCLVVTLGINCLPNVWERCQHMVNSYVHRATSLPMHKDGLIYGSTDCGWDP